MSILQIHDQVHSILENLDLSTTESSSNADVEASQACSEVVSLDIPKAIITMIRPTPIEKRESITG